MFMGRSGSRDMSDTGLHDLKYLRKGIVRMMVVLGRYLERGWFYSRLVSGVRWGGVKYCWNRRSCNFSFRNKFIFVLPCGLLVDNITFSKCAFLKFLLTTLTDDGGFENRNVRVLIIIKSKTMQSLVVYFKLYCAA
jgi:hypothetical protein